METTDYNWVHVIVHPRGPYGHPRHQLDSVVLSPLPAGLVVMGQYEIPLKRERSLLLFGEHVRDDVIFNAEVWDDHGKLQWRGDLDLAVRAAELQRVADLLGTQVHVAQRYVPSRHAGRLKQLAQARLVCTFDPATGTTSSLLAQLSKISTHERSPADDAAVTWKPFGVRGGATCFMDFSPSARRAVAASRLPNLDPSHPQMNDVVGELRSAIMKPIIRNGLCDTREPLMQEMVNKYVNHALADVHVEIRQLGGWEQTP